MNDRNIYRAPDSQRGATGAERANAASRTRGVFVFVVIGILGGIAAQEMHGWLAGAGVMGACIVVSSLLALSPGERERIE